MTMVNSGLKYEISCNARYNTYGILGLKYQHPFYMVYYRFGDVQSAVVRDRGRRCHDGEASTSHVIRGGSRI